VEYAGGVYEHAPEAPKEREVDMTTPTARKDALERRIVALANAKLAGTNVRAAPVVTWGGNAEKGYHARLRAGRIEMGGFDGTLDAIEARIAQLEAV
jgi:hypothetical protein